jgi:hypothetical protein
MNIVATAVEPEFLSLKPDLHGQGAVLTIDLARFEVTQLNNIHAGSLQVILMKTDFENICRVCDAVWPKEDV